ncbi:DotU family type IV/VI secretion system protein [Aeoliella mucimassa]|uniref:Type IV / VI secretion system DotU domain-containing protein n=1 Tax=Aeoliella mucimassa TaxID=2527972 RepID=A0A518AUG8_9BACT|nr:DotU family type IV/VI secretion system protein [Aeoliella mucimassa]QDU58364.1 hypothetical protein Pan181_45980 [Aeoliella mucimassa]
MTVSYRETVDQLVSYALKVHEAANSLGQRNFEYEQAVLLNQLLELPESTSDQVGDLGPRYALACWLDEIFVQDSPWSSQWNENKLESRLYGVNDRAWEFWRLAKVAESRGDEELLRTLYVCVALGFRGQLRNDPESLESWMERTKVRITRGGRSSRSMDVFDTPMSTPPLLTGEREFRRASTAAMVATLASAPVITYALVQYVLR